MNNRNRPPPSTSGSARPTRATVLASEAQAIRTRHQCAQRLLEPLGVVIPWADQLTFRTDQTRYRRDHAKYLSLIASVTLLHQYQRQETERTRDGVSERCVVATLEDLRGGQPIGQRHARPAARRAPAADPPAAGSNSARM